MAWSFGALGILLGCSWNVLYYAAGVSWDDLGASWDALGVSLGALGMFSGFFGVFWGILECFGRVLGMLSWCSWCPLGPPEMFLGRSWNLLGCSWTALGMLLGSPGYVLNLLGCSWGALANSSGAFEVTFENLYGEEGALRCSWVPKREINLNCICFIRSIN